MNASNGSAGAPQVDVYLALGSNQGDRMGFLREAIEWISTWPEVDALEVSGVYESAYVGPFAPQSPYLNLCVRLRTALGAHELLDRTQALERDAGRDPHRSQYPRTLDVDLLLHGQSVHDDELLTVPHPRLRERRFVLQPLSDLCAGLRLPPDGASVAEVLVALDSSDQPLRRWEVPA